MKSIDLMTPQEIMDQLETNKNKIPEHKQEFYLSVSNQFQRRGSISEKQLYWMRKFCFDYILAPKIIQENSAPKKITIWESYDLSRLHAMLSHALSHGLKYPSITLQKDKHSPPLKIYWSDRYQVATIKCGQDRLCNISPNGTLITPNEHNSRLKNMNKLAECLNFLQEFNDHPEAGAKIQGKITSNCCFCSHELSTPESIAVGYGPICAEHYGLPWGYDKAKTTGELSLQQLGLD